MSVAAKAPREADCGELDVVVVGAIEATAGAQTTLVEAVTAPAGAR